MAKILINKGKKEYIEELGKEYQVIKPKQYYVNESADFHTIYGIIKKQDLEKKDGSILKTSQDKEFTIITAEFIDKFKRIKKLAQTIPLKDIGIIIAETGINKNSIIVDAGTGSGALACFLANICKQIASYDINEKHQEIAKQNICELGIKNIELKNKDFYKQADEKDVDAVILDLPEPWKAINTAEKILKIGGFLVNYSPQITQTQELVNELSKKDSFIVIKVIELIERQWKIEGKIVRPKSSQAIHSGFLTFARRVK